MVLAIERVLEGGLNNSAEDFTLFIRDNEVVVGSDGVSNVCYDFRKSRTIKCAK